MRGMMRRSSSRQGREDGRRAAAPVVILVVAALLAACGEPAPSTSATRTESPGSPAPTPAGSPGTSPAASPVPADDAWTRGVELPPLEPVATFVATEASAAGVRADTAFRLTPLDGSDPVVLAGRLTADPPLDLDVTSSGATALVTPRSPLKGGQRYRFALTAPDGTVQGTWAVQAVGPLAVAVTTPGDGSTGVPVDTGIEVTFNQDGVDIAQARPFIAVSPSTPGHLVQAGRTIAFVPENPLAKGTLYTLTVRHGLPLAGTGITLERDAVIRFETAGRTPSGVHMDPVRSLVETRPTEKAVIAINVEREQPDDNGDGTTPEVPMPKRVDVTIHRLASIEDAVAAWRAIEAAPTWADLAGSAPVATSGLPRELSRSLPLRVLSPDMDWLASITLPSTLKQGWHLVTITYDSVPHQVVLQATDLAAYTVVTETRTLAWVNDLRTRGPVAGATATLAGERVGTTGARGLVVGHTPASVANGDAGTRAPVLVVRKGGAAVFVPSGTLECDKCDAGTDGAAPWQLVFGPDRYEYRSTDTVNAWGVIRDRGTGAIPERVDVRLATWSDESGTAVEVETLHAAPDRNGAFMVQVPLREIPYGEYRLELLVHGAVVTDRGITVGVIEKPAWTMHLGTSRHAAVTGSTVLVTADAAFFEGTPVAGAGLVVEAGDRTANATTDAAGTGTTRMALALDGDPLEGDQWDTVEISAHPQLPEEGEITASTDVAVFRADVILADTAVVDGSHLVVAGTVNDVAYERFEQAEPGWIGEIDPYGKAHPGATVRIKVIETLTTWHKSGTDYNFITKRTEPVWVSETHERTLGTRTVQSDGTGHYRVTFPVAGPDRTYDVQVRTTDAEGRETATSDQAETRSTRPTTEDPWIDGAASEEGWSVGDRVTMRLNGGRGAGQPGTVLWTTTRAGLRSWALTTVPRWATTFRAADVPGFTVEAVRFNGRTYEVVPGETRVGYRLTDRRMTVTVTPDQAHYAPGGQATLAVRTTDAGGHPVSASVYLSVVDEKLVALGLVDQGSPLESLYADVGSGLIGVAWTHHDPQPPSGGEGGDTTGGGGGGGGGRTDFRDWLVARIVRTGADGRASVSFELSDDLTSWHAFASGVSHSLLAGTGEARLPVSIPFFAELTVAETYLAADRPAVAVRAFGAGLATDDTVTFTVSSDTLPMAPVIVRAPAFTAAEVPLPPLTPGTHRLRVEAVTGTGASERRDVLTRTFTVVTSRTSQAAVTSSPLDRPTAVSGGAGLTTLVLGDAGRGRVIPVLTSLAGGDLVRGDRALAAGLAARILRDTFRVEPDGQALDLQLGGFQPGDGGYAVLPYASPDLALSALAALSGDPRLKGLDAYFSAVTPTTREETAWVLAGRAATGAPVLNDVRALAATAGLSLDERVPLAIAALAAGDEALAGSLERSILRQAGERHGPWVRIASPAGSDASIVLTARLAVVAAALGDAVAADMDAYLETHEARTTVVDLERALAAKGWVARMPAADAVAALTVDGKRSDVRIDASRPATVVLTAAQAAGARLEPVSGSVLVTTYSEQPLDPASLTPPQGQEVTRSVQPAGTVAVSDAVVVTLKVRLAARAEDTCWMVTEHVPSGLVPVTGGTWAGADDGGDDPGADPAPVTPWNVVGQRVDFCVTMDPAHPVQTLRYVARVVTSGTYRWEETVLQSALEPGVGTVLPATSLTIAGRE